MSTQHICIVESLTGDPAAKLTYWHSDITFTYVSTSLAYNKITLYDCLCVCLTLRWDGVYYTLLNVLDNKYKTSVEVVSIVVVPKSGGISYCFRKLM